jgi:adenine-specific DNA-methyltransferase
LGTLPPWGGVRSWGLNIIPLPLGGGCPKGGRGDCLSYKDLMLLAKSMRSKMTPTEQKMWYYLRNNRLCGYKFKRQVVIGDFIVDFVSDSEKLIIEIDGGQHNSEDSLEYDRKRTEYLNDKGYKVLRFWNNQVLNEMDVVLDLIYRALKG